MNRILKFCAEFFFAAFISSSLFISCASNAVEVEPKTPAVFVTNLKKVNLLTAENISKPVDEVQLFEGTFGENSFSFPLYIQADDKGISISILNDFGTSMGELTYSDNVVEFTSELFPENLKAEYVVWDIQLALYKTEEITNRLSKHKLVFAVEENDGVQIRKILDGENTIEEVIIKKNYIEIKNLLRGYEYHLIGVGNE